MVTDNERIYFEMAENSRKQRINENGEVRSGNSNVLSDLADIKARIDAENAWFQSWDNYFKSISIYLNQNKNYI